MYLRASPTACLRRLHKRARGEEVSVDANYLSLLHMKHENWLTTASGGKGEWHRRLVKYLTASQKVSLHSGGSESKDEAIISEVKMDCGGASRMVSRYCWLFDAKPKFPLQVPVLVIDCEEDVNVKSEKELKSRLRTDLRLFYNYLKSRHYK